MFLLLFENFEYVPEINVIRETNSPLNNILYTSKTSYYKRHYTRRLDF